MKRLWIIVLLVVVGLTLAAPAAPAAACGPRVHIVRYGETLFSIGRWYGVNPWTIANVNGLVNPNYIYPGQRLSIPGTACYTPPPQTCYNCGYGRGYVVRYGDTLSTIAWRHGVDMWSIAQANGIYNLNHIYAGQYLVIP
jgi:putative chitinase